MCFVFEKFYNGKWIVTTFKWKKQFRWYLYLSLYDSFVTICINGMEQKIKTMLRSLKKKIRKVHEWNHSTIRVQITKIVFIFFFMYSYRLCAAFNFLYIPTVIIIHIISSPHSRDYYAVHIITYSNSSFIKTKPCEFEF